MMPNVNKQKSSLVSLLGFFDYLWEVADDGLEIMEEICEINLTFKQTIIILV